MNKIPESQAKTAFKKFIRTVTIVLCFYLLYLISFGGQYSFKNYHLSKQDNVQARQRNLTQVEENNKLAEENYLILTDVEKQTELSNELGYKEEGEQIIKRTD
jgi:uncharacterized membrane protein affecting hemolysin expression